MRNKRVNNLRIFLIQDIHQRLISLFLKKGFSVIPLPTEEMKSELKTAFPLGRLKRNRGNELDIIEFQFDKYGRPKFVINFGIVPEGGVILPWGDHLNQSVADVSALSDSYRLYCSSLRANWFELGLLSPKNEKAIVVIVDKAISISGEINNWFEFKAVGKHMRKYKK